MGLIFLSIHPLCVFFSSLCVFFSSRCVFGLENLVHLHLKWLLIAVHVLYCHFVNSFLAVFVFPVCSFLLLLLSSFFELMTFFQFSSVAQSCLTLCDPMNCSCQASSFRKSDFAFPPSLWPLSLNEKPAALLVLVPVPHVALGFYLLFLDRGLFA